MISQQFIDYYGEKPFLDILVAKLIFHEVQDLSDTEIDRSFRDCALSDKLSDACKELRHKINWSRVIDGQNKYRKECDNINHVHHAQNAKQIVLNF